MGLFDNSFISEFKSKFTENVVFITGYSFRNLNISDEVAVLKMRANYQELKDLAKRFDDPFNEYFRIYQRSIAGIKISVCEALYITYECMSSAIYLNEKITQNKSEKVIQEAQKLSRSNSGREILRDIVYGH